ncbi:50S ribosomal protein L19 [Patescibacteria group bacterium]|nr:50S ribosomal protein L19 [Patescibacteria group bacterium]MBU1682650.1 50S ribosomal protein L19 [Patescibacteria group bacterium]MBU1935648.1 50S ribosomal protein L19 [Patescibacteria group bacterium]
MHPLIRSIQQKLLKKVPEIKSGYTVRVSQKITEGAKERIQNFEGLVIKVGHGEGAERTFTVRKMVEGIGVEKIFPLHSPNITKIVVKKKAKVRRSKLYYMRQRFGKSARLSERHVTDEERATEEAKMEAMIAEAVKAEEKRKKEERAANPEQAEAAVEQVEEAPADEEVGTRDLASEEGEGTEEATPTEPVEDSESVEENKEEKPEEPAPADEPEEKGKEEA